MAYTGKNPKFNSTILTDQTTSSVDSPASGSHKLVNRDGVLHMRDSAGNETPVGSSSSGVNLIENNNGQVALDRSATNDLQDWIDSGAGTTSTRTTTASEIPLNTNVDTAIKIAFATGTTNYTRVRFTMPESLKNHKLGIKWIQRVSSYTADTAKVELYYNAASNYGGAYTEVALSSDDSSGDTYIPNLNGVVNGVAFDEGGNDYYELRIVNAGATTGFVSFNEFEVGPGAIGYGPAIGPLNSYTPSGLTGGEWGTSTNIDITWQQDVEHMIIRGEFTTGTTTAAEAQIDLPTGYTIGGTETGPIVAGILETDVAGVSTFRTLYTPGDTYLNVGRWSNTGSENALAPINASNTADATRISFYARVPIAEWEGAGPLYAGQNNVEYMSNSNTSTSVDDTSSFVYGPAGSSIVAISSANAVVSKRVQSQSSSQLTDKWSLVVSPGNNVWLEAGSVFPFIDTGTAIYGMRVTGVSATQVDVEFGGDGATQQDAWSTYTSWAWAVVRHRQGIPVGFGLASADNTGLVRRRAFHARDSTGQGTLTSGVFTKVQFDTEDFDVGGDFDNSTNYRFTPTVAGKYRITWQVHIAGDTVNTVRAASAWLYKNGTGDIAGTDLNHTTTAYMNAFTSIGSAIVDANGTTDYFEVFAQGVVTSGTWSISVTNKRTYFNAQLVTED